MALTGSPCCRRVRFGQPSNNWGVTADGLCARPDIRLHTGMLAIPVGYFNSRDIRRSASTLPPVWQVAQYWNERSA